MRPNRYEGEAPRHLRSSSACYRYFCARGCPARRSAAGPAWRAQAARHRTPRRVAGLTVRHILSRGVAGAAEQQRCRPRKPRQRVRRQWFVLGRGSSSALPGPASAHALCAGSAAGHGNLDGTWAALDSDPCSAGCRTQLVSVGAARGKARQLKGVGASQRTCLCNPWLS